MAHGGAEQKNVCVCKKLAKVPAPNLNWPFVCVISVCGSSSILPFKMKRPPFPRLDATWTDEIRGEEPPLPPAPTSAEGSCWTVRCNVHNFLHVENPATIPQQFSCGPGKHMLGAPDVSLPYGISAFLMRNHRTSSIKMGSGILICNVRLLTFAELHTRATARFCAPNLVRGGSWISNAAGGFVFFYSLKAWVCACVCVCENGMQPKCAHDCTGIYHKHYRCIKLLYYYNTIYIYTYTIIYIYIYILNIPHTYVYICIYKMYNVRN